MKISVYELLSLLINLPKMLIDYNCHLYSRKGLTGPARRITERSQNREQYCIFYLLLIDILFLSLESRL